MYVSLRYLYVARTSGRGLRVVIDIVDRIEDRSPAGIAAAVSRLISSGRAHAGQPAADGPRARRPVGHEPDHGARGVADAVAGRRDRVARPARHVRAQRPAPARAAALPADVRRTRHFRLDLSTGTPDPRLLPDLGPVLARVSRRVVTTSYLDDPVVPELDEQLRLSWPFPPEAMTVVDGALDALDRIASVTLRLGDRVLVEASTFPPLLDLLEQIGAEPIGLAIDESGIVPAALQEALAREPVALILQPRAHNPTGVRTTAPRVRKLAAVLRGTDVLVIEDDHSGDIASGADVSLGKHLPGQTVHIRSFSKSHGPTFGWLRSAAQVRSSPPLRTAGCSVRAGRAGCCSRCSSSCCATRPASRRCTRRVRPTPYGGPR
jgi:hypothetical protein